jgi:hypothetical protein
MSVVMEMHQEHVARRARLMDGTTPRSKPKPLRPVSPFMREAQRRQTMTWNAVMYLRAHPLPTVWEYMPPVEYDHCEGGREYRVTVARITAEVAKKHGLTIEDIRSSRRDRAAVKARHEVFWRCRKETTHSLPSIGRFLNKKDHTTIMHGIKMHEKRMREAADA